MADIRDSTQVSEELSSVTLVLESLATRTEGFKDFARFKPSAIADVFKSVPKAEQAVWLASLARLLFLVTARTDNNCKCQFPIFLRQQAKWKTFPTLRQGKLVDGPIPRVIKADTLMDLIGRLDKFPDRQRELLEEFVAFILSDQHSLEQFWAIGHSYFVLQRVGKGVALLAPLVVFQVRGSVAASGGHDPEELLRKEMELWGLVPGVDFNEYDVVLGDLLTKLNLPSGPTSTQGKTRAYDFILPYMTPGWTPKILVQCQFYAGDSGSVSHKNVDQTRHSRDVVKKILPNVRFVEYVDGAGYCASLNGDLKSLFDYTDTATFFQIRSAPIRLRRQLQSEGFLLPIDLEHAISLTAGDLVTASKNLRADKYSAGEISRVLNESLKRGRIKKVGEKVIPNGEVREISRRYCLLDLICRSNRRIGKVAPKSEWVLISGYGAGNGLPMEEVVSIAKDLEGLYGEDWANTLVLKADLDWLVGRGFCQIILTN